MSGALQALSLIIRTQGKLCESKVRNFGNVVKLTSAMLCVQLGLRLGSYRILCLPTRIWEVFCVYR